MGRSSAGFTLIELIAVIVILGILAATAIPRFFDLQTAADEAAVAGIAGALSSAAALNHANNIAADANLTTPTAVITVDSCDDVANLLSGGLPADYVIETTAVGTNEGDSQTDCTVGKESGDTAGFQVGEDLPQADFTAYNVAP